MRIELAAFTESGLRLAETLAARLAEEGDSATATRIGGGGPKLGEWTEKYFGSADALVFVGAAGIAVRAIAPHLVSKTSDPAVAVVDDAGRFAVSLLSGHIGGANELAERVAGLIGAVPVVTTATDARNVFAVDVWAKKAGLAIANPDRIKAVSSRLLAGGTVRLWSVFPVAGELPPGVIAADCAAACDVAVDVRHPENPENDGALLLVPPALVLGVGCRRGTGCGEIEAAFLMFIEKNRFPAAAFRAVQSIDLKKDEPGLVAFCEKNRLPFATFPAEELAAVPGDFSGSDFVKSVAGVDNVCERSAVAGGGKLLVRKTVFPGVTMAAALIEQPLGFEKI